MTVYVRTQAGRHAAYSPASALPRKLSSILKIIDGKTTADAYVQSLKAFGDVRGVLRALYMADLIRPESNVPYADSDTHSASDFNAPNLLDGLQEQARLVTQNEAALRKPMPHGPVPGQPIYTEPETQPGFMQTRKDTAQDNLERTQTLSFATDMMANFVLTYVPDQAFALLGEIEQIASLEQLAVALGGYSQMIGQAGKPAEEHILLLKQFLHDAM